MRRFFSPFAVIGLFVLASCGHGCQQPPSSLQGDTRPGDRSNTVSSAPPPASAARIVAIGDLHGDLAATRSALELAGAIDAQQRWIGGALVIVQTGDLLDRGDEDREVLDLFDRLVAEAPRTGGRVVSLLGNHETMNTQGWMDYVTEAAYESFKGLRGLDLLAAWLADFPEFQRPRRAAFAPGGPYARRLAQRDVVTQINGTIFAHGGVSAEHQAYGLNRLNEETRQWLLGQTPQPEHVNAAAGGPLWSYLYSQPEVAEEACQALQLALAASGASRMVIGHTVQEGGINAACEGRVWRIDVGVSKYYRGLPLQVLEIVGEQVRVLE